MKSALLLALVALVSAPQLAQEVRPGREPANPLKLRLVAGEAAARSGEPMLVGLHLSHPANYHSYWKAPGIVGIPTRIEWTLPPGFEAGPLRWPVPSRVDMAGHNAHGYRGEVLLAAEIRPPDGWTGEIEIQGRASWMCCHKTCHPGARDLSVRVSWAEKAIPAAPAVRALFQAHRENLPRGHDGWKIVAARSENGLRLQVEPEDGVKRAPPKELYFFCARNFVDSNAPQKLGVQGQQVTLDLRRSPVWEAREPAHLEGLLYRPDGWGGTDDGHVGRYLPLKIAWPARQSSEQGD